MVELEHTRSLLEQMGLHTAAQLLDAQLEQALHSQQTYVQFLHDLLTSEQQERQRKSQTMCPPQKMPVLSTWSVQPDGDKALAALHQDDAVLFQELGQLIQVRHLKGDGAAVPIDAEKDHGADEIGFLSDVDDLFRAVTHQDGQARDTIQQIGLVEAGQIVRRDRKSTRLNSSHPK